MMMFNKYYLMNEVTEHGGEGSGGDASPASTSILAGVGQETSRIDNGNDTGLSADVQNANANPENDWLPDKFKVLNTDGSVNYELSAQKLTGSYKHLEGRVGTGDIPPKSPDEYNIDLGDSIKFDEFKNEPDTKEFLEEAVKHGLTNKQAEFVLQKYVQALPKFLEVVNSSTQEQAQAELSKEWATEKELESNLKNAYQAFQRYASPADKEHIDSIGNNPVVIRLLANIGKGLQEDQGVSKPQGITSVDVKSLMASEAYRNPSHPEHNSTRSKVSQFYRETYGNQVIS